jgi:hypothetical protein
MVKTMGFLARKLVIKEAAPVQQTERLFQAFETYN